MTRGTGLGLQLSSDFAHLSLRRKLDIHIEKADEYRTETVLLIKTVSLPAWSTRPAGNDLQNSPNC